MKDAEGTIQTQGPRPAEKVYVHLCSGEVREIEGVDEIAMTDAYVIFTRGNLEAVVIDRREIYYSCCEADDTPSSY
jgi:hypothetical protein